MGTRIEPISDDDLRRVAARALADAPLRFELTEGHVAHIEHEERKAHRRRTKRQRRSR